MKYYQKVTCELIIKKQKTSSKNFILNLVSNFKITQTKQSRKNHENPKISIFTSASSDRSAGIRAKNRNEARSEPKNGLYYVKGKLLRRHVKDASLQRPGPLRRKCDGYGLSEAKAAAAYAYTRDRRAGRYGGAISRLF